MTRRAILRRRAQCERALAACREQLRIVSVRGQWNRDSLRHDHLHLFLAESAFQHCSTNRSGPGGQETSYGPSIKILMITKEA